MSTDDLGQEIPQPRTLALDEFEHGYFVDILFGLSSLGALQRPMLEKLGYYDTSTETLSRYGLALIIEVGEFLNETPWKAWKKDPTKPHDPAKIVEEFVDMLSFVGSWINFLGLLGIKPMHITRAYQAKLMENNARFGVDPLK